jgi:hypothetical protein
MVKDANGFGSGSVWIVGHTRGPSVAAGNAHTTEPSRRRGVGIEDIPRARVQPRRSVGIRAKLSLRNRRHRCDTNMAKDQGNSQQEPMTAAQAVDLKGLAEAALEPDAFDPSLTKAQAALRINALKAKLRLMSEPPHPA